MYLEAAALLRSGMQAAAERGHPLPHAHKAKPVARRPGAGEGAGAVIVDLDGQGLRGVVQVH